MLSWVTMEAEEAKMGEVILNPRNIGKLRSWCEGCSYLPHLNDNEFALFLANTMGNRVLAMHNLQHYYTLRASLPQYFYGRDPYSDELQNIFKAVAIVPLKTRTSQAHQVIFVTLIDSDPELFDLTAFLKYFNMVLDICIYEEGISSGFVILVDIHRMTMLHVKGLEESVLKDLARYYSAGLPADLYAIHIVNSGRKKNEMVHTFMDALVEKYKFVCEYVLYFHDSWRSVAYYMSLDILPYEIGPLDRTRTEAAQRHGRLLDLHNAQVKKLESHAYTLFAMDQRFQNVRNELLLLKKNSEHSAQSQEDLDRSMRATCHDDV